MSSLPPEPSHRDLHSVAAIPHDAAPCVLHKYHEPVTVLNELHHVFPQYLQESVWGKGITPDQEKRPICATSHNSVHVAITGYLKTGVWPRWCVGKTRDLCEEAIARLNAAKETT
jgi:hypothetical protein